MGEISTCDRGVQTIDQNGDITRDKTESGYKMSYPFIPKPPRDHLRDGNEIDFKCNMHMSPKVKKRRQMLFGTNQTRIVTLTCK